MGEYIPGVLAVVLTFRTLKAAVNRAADYATLDAAGGWHVVKIGPKEFAVVRTAHESDGDRYETVVLSYVP